MVAVPADQGAEIRLMPVGKEQVIVVPLLAGLPAIKRFVHHDHAQTVTHLQQFGRGRIMAGADGIAAHLLQNLNLPFQGPRADRRTQRPEVMMIADPIQRHALAVQQKTVVRRELNRADAERGFATINAFPILLNRGLPRT